jgi:hypothetical protein
MSTSTWIQHLNKVQFMDTSIFYFFIMLYPKICAWLCSPPPKKKKIEPNLLNHRSLFPYPLKMPKHSGRPVKPVLSICLEVQAQTCPMHGRIVASKNRNTWGTDLKTFSGIICKTVTSFLTSSTSLSIIYSQQNHQGRFHGTCWRVPLHNSLPSGGLKCVCR